MKKYITTGKGLLAALLMGVAMASCSENAMDAVNNDTNHTKDAPSKFILADVLTSTAFNNIGGDFSTYTSCYIEHEVGVYNQLYNAETRSNEPSAASTFNNTWGTCYTALKNARIVIDKCSAGGSQEGNAVTKGIAEVLAAYNSALIADLFGDAPWSEAAIIDESGLPVKMTPKIDKQEDIYKGVMDYINAAITDLQGEDAHISGGVGNYDLLYKGDQEAWLKLAYGLKARYTMRLLKRSTNPTTDLNNILTYLDNSFTEVGEQAAFNVYDASNLNPLFDFQWSRDYLAASKSLAQKLIARNDPRLRREFISASWYQIKGSSDTRYRMAPNGAPQQRQYYYNTSVFTFAQTASTMFMSYHEALFLRAEALCRLNRSDEALPILKEAVVAAIANTEASVAAAMNAPTILEYGGLAETSAAITTEEAESYFDTYVKPLFTANPLQETMIQKYLAFFGASGEATECYSDVRRLKALGENFITLSNPETAKFPLRLPYGNDDTTTNPEVKAAYGNGQYVYTEPVWWAGGTK